jgi:hypothetical protein
MSLLRYIYNSSCLTTSDYYSYYRVIIECDDSIFETWREGMEDLRYLYRPYLALMTRKLQWITDRSNPRWRKGRWKSKS